MNPIKLKKVNYDFRNLKNSLEVKGLRQFTIEFLEQITSYQDGQAVLSGLRADGTKQYFSVIEGDYFYNGMVVNRFLVTHTDLVVVEVMDLETEKFYYYKLN